jgi:hypothetical protein
VIGRTELKTRLSFQAAMPASNTAFPSARNIFASSSRECPSRAETNCPTWSQRPGGWTVAGPSCQNSAIIFCSSVRPALRLIRSCAWVVYAELPDFAGPVSDCPYESEGSANGTTLFRCGVANTCVTCCPVASVYTSGCQESGSLTVAGSNAATTIGSLAGR